MIKFNRTLTAAGAAMLMVPFSGHANNGHFMVDHAVIADPGRCQFESWVNRSDVNDNDTVSSLVAVPACTLANGWQLSVPLQYGITENEFDGAGLKAKTMVASGHAFGDIALAFGADYSRHTDRIERLYVNLPWSAEVSDSMSWHLNGGLTHRRHTNNLYTTWGLAGNYSTSENAFIVFEVASVGSNTPSAALGARLTFQQTWELDFSVGRDFETRGDFANVGLNIRF